MASAPKKYRKEADVKKQVKALLDRFGWFYWMPPANGYGRVGIADINALKAGVFLAPETKFGSNLPTNAQCAYLESIAAESGFGFVVNEKNIEVFERWLTLFDAATKAISRGEAPTDEMGAGLLDCVALLTQPIFEARAKIAKVLATAH